MSSALAVRHSELGVFQLSRGLGDLGSLTIFHAFMEEKCCLVVLSTLSASEDRLTAKWVSPVASVMTGMTSH